MQTIKTIINESGLKRQHIAKVLGVSAPTLKLKIEDPTSFTGKEISALWKLIGTNIDNITFANFFYDFCD